ncbi:hypothetical protein BSLG_003813 [Batrachochytrium salamandrivorans]|nr:hypothetical protein BSLG_003813 [Batrachochytrium salamandrivorans]
MRGERETEHLQGENIPAEQEYQSIHGPSTSCSDSVESQLNSYRLAGSCSGSAGAGQCPVIGLLKVGHKRLFLIDEYDRQIEVSPLCVLDFYIHESFQRKGFGKRLFEYMLMIEFRSPGELCYDRPSAKFLGFLRNHYHLTEYIPQSNNFVVFKQFGLGMLELDTKGRPKLPPKLDRVAMPHKQTHMRSPVRSQRVSDFTKKFNYTLQPISDTFINTGLMESDYTSNALSRNSPNSARKNSSVKAIVLEPVDQIIASMTQQLNSDLTHHIPPWMGASDTLLKPDSQVSLHSQARQPEAEIRADLTGDDKKYTVGGTTIYPSIIETESVSTREQDSRQQSQEEYRLNDAGDKHRLSRYDHHHQLYKKNELQQAPEYRLAPQSGSRDRTYTPYTEISSSHYNKDHGGETQRPDSLFPPLYLSERPNSRSSRMRMTNVAASQAMKLGVEPSSQEDKRRTEGVPIDPIEGPIDWVGSVKAGGTVSTITSRFHNGPEHPAQDLERKARIRTLMKADKLPHLPPATIGYTNNLLNPQLSSIARLAGGMGVYTNRNHSKRGSAVPSNELRTVNYFEKIRPIGDYTD